MYFKQRENSPLYQHYQKLQHQRLAKKLEEIKTHKIKTRESTDRLPPITHRPSDLKIYQKKMILAETDRLNKKINELRTNRSAYFSKVIGLNLSMEMPKRKKNTKKSVQEPNPDKSLSLQKTESLQS